MAGRGCAPVLWEGIVIPAIANAQTVNTCRLEFNEPLTPEDRLFISLMAERYENKDGIPFMTFSRDGRTTLICPSTIRMIIPHIDLFEPQSAQA